MKPFKIAPGKKRRILGVTIFNRGPEDVYVQRDKPYFAQTLKGESTIEFEIPDSPLAILQKSLRKIRRNRERA